MKIQANFDFPEDVERKREWERYSRWGRKSLSVELSDSDHPQGEIREYEISKNKKEEE